MSWRSASGSRRGFAPLAVMAFRTLRPGARVLAMLAVSVFTQSRDLAAEVARAGEQVRIVSHDPGGPVEARAREIVQLRARDARVEIRGDCWSSCTMYLALPRTCVSRDALLGFHGPGSGMPGIGLIPAEFERASQMMARHYPEPLRGWFLREGRVRTVGFHRFSGRQLIAMGLAECRDG